MAIYQDFPLSTGNLAVGMVYMELPSRRHLIHPPR
jgi:hypothetical protein